MKAACGVDRVATVLNNKTLKSEQVRMTRTTAIEVPEEFYLLLSAGSVQPPLVRAQFSGHSGKDSAIVTRRHFDALLAAHTSEVKAGAWEFDEKRSYEVVASEFDGSRPVRVVWVDDQPIPPPQQIEEQLSGGEIDGTAKGVASSSVYYLMSHDTHNGNAWTFQRQVKTIRPGTDTHRRMVLAREWAKSQRDSI